LPLPSPSTSSTKVIEKTVFDSHQIQIPIHWVCNSATRYLRIYGISKIERVVAHIRAHSGEGSTKLVVTVDGTDIAVFEWAPFESSWKETTVDITNVINKPGTYRFKVTYCKTIWRPTAPTATVSVKVEIYYSGAVTAVTIPEPKEIMRGIAQALPLDPTTLIALAALGTVGLVAAAHIMGKVPKPPRAVTERLRGVTERVRRR